MPRSMTGFGQADQDIFHVEVKGLNHRYQEIRVKLPRELNQLEMPLRKMIQNNIHRGKVELTLTRNQSATGVSGFAINWDQAATCHEAITKMAEKFGGEVNFRDIMWIPGIMSEEKEGIEKQWPSIETAAKEALSAFDESRLVEGNRIKEDMRSRIDSLIALCDNIEELAGEMKEIHRDRLTTRLDEIMADKDLIIDEVRLAQEVIILADKSDITEEIVRLRSHLKSFAKDIETDSKPVGRRLDFLLQEINREYNTIGSKSQLGELSHLVIDAKAEVEKVREQAQNIE